MNTLVRFLQTTLIVLLVTSCGQAELSDLNHRDNAAERGAEKATPWHFHTGKGVRVESFRDSKGNLETFRDKCTITPKDPSCQEQVYFFQKQEIMAFLNVAINQYESQITGRAASAALAGTIAVITGKAALAGFAAPDPTMITKVFATGSAAISGVSAIVVAWEGYKINQIYALMREINQWFDNEAKFANQCGHLRKNFVKKAAEFGITIYFNKDGAQLIEGKHFLKAVEKEKVLYQKTLDYAVNHKIPAHKAWERFFINQCGQLPMTTLSPADKMFSQDWAYVPERIKQHSFDLSNALALESGTVVEMTQFDSNDLDSDKEYSSMRKFLITLKINIKRIASLGTDKEKAALAKFRKDYNQVIIQPQWGGDTYRVATYNSKKVLYINARWGMFRGGYIISAKQALKDLMGINLDSRFMAD